MKKIKLRKKKKFVKTKLLLIIIMIIIFISFYYVVKIGKKINKKIYEVSSIEIENITKKIIEFSVDNTVLENMNINNIINIEKDSNGKIIMIDIDSRITNGLLTNINNNINKYIKEFENGKSSILNLNKNIITNKNIISRKDGIILEIPIGMISNNSLLKNLGPKIPIRVSINGNYTTSIKPKIETYGINVNVIKIILNVEVNEQIIIPIETNKKTINCEIILLTRIIQGEIPNYYLQS